MTTLSKNHKTAVFIRTSTDDSDTYQARVNRFVDSINRQGQDDDSTIKADLYVTDDSANLWAVSPYAHQAHLRKYDVEDVGSPTLRRVAGESGYEMTIFVSPTSNETFNYGDISSYSEDSYDEDVEDEEDVWIPVSTAYSPPVAPQVDNQELLDALNEKLELLDQRIAVLSAR